MNWNIQDPRVILQLDSLRRLMASDGTRKALSTLAVLSLIYATNKALNRLVLNGTAAGHRWDWRKEIILVTGGSSGLGELVVRKLAKRSIKVVAVDLHPPKTPFPANVFFYQLDVTSPEAIRQVAQSIRQDVGEPTVLVNNAGVGAGKPMLEETEQEIRRTFEVNVVAHFFLVREFLPWMISENHGHIITIASMASFMTIASNVDYSCSKAAALSFHEGLTQELKYRYNASNVRTSIIHPTWVRTAMLEPLLKRGPFTDTILEPNGVAEAIVAQVLGGKSGQVILPVYYGWVSGIRGFPAWMQEIMRNSKAHVLRK